MMEMMMAAHQEANTEKIVLKEEEIKKTTKTFGGGFKKGFFGNEKSEKTGKKTEKTGNKVVKELSEKEAYLAWMQNKGASTSNPNPNTIPNQSNTNSSSDKNSDIPTIKKNSQAKNVSAATASITADIQKAMSDDESPMLKQLKQGGRNQMLHAYLLVHTNPNPD
jgi:hypothetical protein